MPKKPSLLAFLTVTSCLSFLIPAAGQVYSDYIGAGHTEGVRICTSGTRTPSTSLVTIDRWELDSAFMRIQASRFLAQATLGADRATIDQAAEIGFEAWIDEQLAISSSSTEEELAFALEVLATCCDQSGELSEEECFGISEDWGFTFNIGW